MMPTLCAAILVASLALATTASMWHGEAALLPVVVAAEADEVSLDGASSTSHALQPVLHSPAGLHLHPSTLTLSQYPAVGGGATELVFTVTYGGDILQALGIETGPVEPPVVRLDVTGSGYRDLYRVTNITSNIGTAASDIFEPYDHESETVRAVLGATYTVRAMVEFVAEGLISVHAFGFDADRVTVDVAASEYVSMPYSEYVATRQNYLDGVIIAQTPDPVYAGTPMAEKRRTADQISHPLAESQMQPPFNATGTIRTESWNGTTFIPVHGIEVCVYDGSSMPHTLLYTTANEPACDYTDTSGRYAILNVSGADPDDMTAADALVTVQSRGYNGTIDLKWYNRANNMSYAYNATSTMERDHAGPAPLVTDINLTDPDPVASTGRGFFHVLRSTPSEGMAGAARIISTISDGIDFFKEHGQSPANLSVMWNHMDGTSIYTNNSNRDGAYYDSNITTIYFDGSLPINSTHNSWTEDNSRNRHVIIHEYAHHVHFTHDSRLSSLFDCQVHYLHKKYDEGCGWGEGWAQLVPHLVYESARIQVGPFGSTIDLEAGQEVTLLNKTYKFVTFEESRRPVGEKVEGTVAAAMWDMIDVVNDSRHDMSLPGWPTGSDNIAVGVDALVDLFFAGWYDNFADFYDRWEIDMRHNSAESVAKLHGMAFSIPSNTSYYGFAGELGGVFTYEMSDLLDTAVSDRLQFRPTYVDVSDDGSIIAITSSYGQGLQMVDAQTGEHLGLYATDGYDHICTLKEDVSTCLGNRTARITDTLGPAGFSSMDGIAFGLNSSVVLVSDGLQNRVQVIGSDGGYLGKFGSIGTSNGEFLIPDGVSFLADDMAAAVADAGNSRIQILDIAGNGSVQYTNQFDSYDPAYYQLSIIRQQLETGVDGTLYAAGFDFPGIWMYPPPHDSSTPTLITDPSLRNLGGIDIGQDGLVYVSDWAQSRIRVYDPSNLQGNVSVLPSQIGDRPIVVHDIQGGTGIRYEAGAEAFIDEFGSQGRHSWQLGKPLGVALGPPDSRTGDVRVYVADGNGIKMYEKDRLEPRVESVWAHTPDGTVIPSDTVEIAVNFTERVTVIGTPILALETGMTGSNAMYVSGSGSRTLTFNHTVDAGAGPSYIDYGGTGSLSLLSGAAGDPEPAIVDGGGNAANLTLPARGTAGSLAANAALWIDASRADEAPFEIAAPTAVGAVEHQAVRFNVTTVGSAPAAAGSYSMAGAPAGAAISAGGMFTWTPGERQNGMHAFVVSASAQGDSSMSHARTFRIQVAEDNAAPEVAPVADREAYALSELRFDIAATDDDLPAQPLEYRLTSDLQAGDRPVYAAVLPNGTFVWTPSMYDIGTFMFNVTVSDGFGNDGEQGVSSVEFNVTVSLGPTPTPVSVYALELNGLAAAQDATYMANQTVRIGVNFSEAVTVQAGPGGGTPYLRLSTGSDGARATYNSGNNTETLMFTYAVRAGDATSRLSYAGTGALALNGATIVSSGTGEPASVALPDPASQGPLGRIVGTTTGGDGDMTPGNNVTLVVGSSGVGASEDLGDRGDEARVTLDVGRITTSGGSATFPRAGVAINTSFAHVTFPPGAVATSVPADRMLVLYIADDLPDNSTVQRLLGYAGSGNVTLQRVVEIGDEDGRIEFNMPVRISLDGQAGGRAFYIAGAGGEITPIDDACAADDAARVHRQLGGSGECQIDAGGDKVVYTYHLTRYGTAAPETGAAPPVDHSCSVRIASDDLPVRVRPGATSTAAPQAVTNAGSLPFERVALNATAWTTNLGERLPAAFTEVSEVGENRGYKRVAEAGATPVAEGLGGGEERQVWFKLNLAGHTEVSGTTLTQSIEYLAECRGPPGQ